MNKEEKELSCMYCGKKACEKAVEEDYPPFCLTAHMSEDLKKKTTELYTKPGIDHDLSLAAAEIEGEYYGKITRAQEIVLFAKRIGAKKIGIASCVGLLKEAQTFCKILEVNGLDFYGIACKVGAVDKSIMGLAEEKKLCPGSRESMCNPIMQAKLLNEEKTDLNVVVGLCVGHDSLFYKYSEAPVTTLITKDRVLGHNPAAALYLTDTYYKKLMKPYKED